MLLIGPCIAHQSNLLTKAVPKVPTFQDVMQQAMTIARKIRVSTAVREIIAKEAKIDRISV